jgi:hypothetical protein
MPLTPQRPKPKAQTRPGWFGRAFGKRSANNLLLELTLKEFHAGKKRKEAEVKKELKEEFEKWRQKHRSNPHNTWWDFLNHKLQG